MTYCTKQDLINAFGEEELIQLTDRSFNAEINEVVLGNAIQKAEVEVDLWIAGSYSLPLASVPPALMYIACDLTRYFLSPDIDGEHPTTLRYREAKKSLQAIARGETSLSPTTNRVDLVQVAPGRNDFSDRSSW